MKLSRLPIIILPWHSDNIAEGSLLNCFQVGRKRSYVWRHIRPRHARQGAGHWGDLRARLQPNARLPAAQAQRFRAGLAPLSSESHPNRMLSYSSFNNNRNILEDALRFSFDRLLPRLFISMSTTSSFAWNTFGDSLLLFWIVVRIYWIIFFLMNVGLWGA